MSRIAQVEIHYRRPPDRLEVFRQHLIHDGPDGKVTFLERSTRGKPLLVEGVAVLEPESPVVWFTFPGEWHDIARFHRANGEFTGIYANVLTPVEERDGLVWDTTDLFLDLWLDERGPRVLDEDELDDALESGWIDAGTAARARAEAERLRVSAASGGWPPQVVHDWTLERVRERMGG